MAEVTRLKLTFDRPTADALGHERMTDLRGQTIPFEVDGCQVGALVEDVEWDASPGRDCYMVTLAIQERLPFLEQLPWQLPGMVSIPERDPQQHDSATGE